MKAVGELDNGQVFKHQGEKYIKLAEEFDSVVAVKVFSNGRIGFKHHHIDPTVKVEPEQ